MGKVLSVEEVAEYLGLAKDTVYRKTKAGEIPGVRIGGSWRFPQDVIDEWLRAKAAGTEGANRAKLQSDRKRQGAGGQGAEKLPSEELSRRRRLLKRIAKTREAFTQLPITAQEAYRASRRELERRSARWK
ncbi:MAG: helix-turn-helix domain-containing protein [Candidatus Tectomicrobia bacterium]|uniref:Helix-turn-helix domain-containing protein n=1 Tax=Tectimicrobiota bacterium TaxID=2528274 RepID=A0A932GP88_UNCTE|nr:helix-turn-helix domain-containing protein [Candidatus Tectomicrobia bacterium]